MTAAWTIVGSLQINSGGALDFSATGTANRTLSIAWESGEQRNHQVNLHQQRFAGTPNHIGASNPPTSWANASHGMSVKAP